MATGHTVITNGATPRKKEMSDCLWQHGVLHKQTQRAAGNAGTRRRQTMSAIRDVKPPACEPHTALMLVLAVRGGSGIHTYGPV